MINTVTVKSTSPFESPTPVASWSSVVWPSPASPNGPPRCPGDVGVSKPNRRSKGGVEGPKNLGFSKFSVDFLNKWRNASFVGTKHPEIWRIDATFKHGIVLGIYVEFRGGTSIYALCFFVLFFSLGQTSRFKMPGGKCPGAWFWQANIGCWILQKRTLAKISSKTFNPPCMANLAKTSCTHGESPIIYGIFMYVRLWSPDFFHRRVMTRSSIPVGWLPWGEYTESLPSTDYWIGWEKQCCVI